MPDSTSLGGRLERLRRARGMTREDFAGQAGISYETVKAIEAGKRNPGHEVLLRIAAVLNVPVSDLTGQPRRRRDDASEAHVLALRDVIQSPQAAGALPGGEDAPLGPGEVRQGVIRGYAAYWAGDFGRLAGMLPDLITSARVARAASAPGMAEPLALARDLAACVLVHFGKPDLALAAAERAVEAAAGGDDPLLHAAMKGTYAWVLLHQARFGAAETVAVAAADACADMTDAPARRRDAARGSLLMTAVAPAAVSGGDVTGYVTEAAATAGALGGPVRLWGTTYSLASVRMQAVHAHAVQREPGRALKEARHVRTAELPGVISRGRHLLDIAQAHVDAGEWGEATGILMQAKRMSPEWFARQEVAALLVGDLLERKMRLSEPLKELARATAAGGRAAYFRPPA